MLAPAIRAGKQCILARQGQRPDRPLDHVGVDLNPPVVHEAGQPLPAHKRIADRLGQSALLADQTELAAQPRLESVQDGTALLLPNPAALCRTHATDVALDAIELRN